MKYTSLIIKLIKSSLSFILLLISFNCFSQLEYKKIVFDLNGGFSKTFNESGVYGNSLSSEIIASNVRFTVGYALNNSIIAGIGFNYMHKDEERINILLLSKTLNYNKTQINSNAVMPVIYLGYYKQIYERLYFSTILNFEIGNIKSDEEWTSIIRTNVNSSGQEWSYIDSTNISAGSFSVLNKPFSTETLIGSISPAFTYYLTSHIGLNLRFGGMEYILPEMDTELAQWNFNFDPTNWKFGLQLVF